MMVESTQIVINDMSADDQWVQTLNPGEQWIGGPVSGPGVEPDIILASRQVSRNHVVLRHGP